MMYDERYQIVSDVDKELCSKLRNMYGLLACLRNMCDTKDCNRRQWNINQLMNEKDFFISNMNYKEIGESHIIEKENNI